MYYTIEAAQGGYRAQLYGEDRQPIFRTEVYDTKQAARHAIDLAKSSYNAPMHDRT